MKTSLQNIGICLALGLSAVALSAQEFDGPPGPNGPGGPGGRGQGGPRMGSPLMMALDTNKDGKLDATEIANAAASLKALDKNGDGELTPDEIGGPRRGGPRGGPNGGPERRPPPSE